eukprot:Gb_41606 [translate_table: standard]
MLIKFVILAVLHTTVLVAADPQATEAGHGCSPNKYVNGSAFRENLNSVLASLAKNVSATGFATSAEGRETPDRVYGLAQCRNDLSSSDCSQCFAQAEKQIEKYCSGVNGARMIMDGCFLRYENSSFYDQAVDPGFSNVCGSQNSTQPLDFNRTTQKLLNEINVNATANGGFAEGSMVQSSPAATTTTTVYALAMCRRSLSNDSCAQCLQAAQNLTLQCLPRRDGKGLEAGCYLRYATFPFVNKVNGSISSQPISSKKTSKTARIISGIIGGSALISIVCLLFIYRHTLQAVLSQYHIKRHSDNREDGYFATPEEPESDHNFNYEALRTATRNFDVSNKLGQGGFGQVFKGTFSDGRQVAVKKLFVTHSTRAVTEFLTEVKLISGVRHRNLVRLLGCCKQGQERLLVYEFMPNNSLDKHLFDIKTKTSLNWKTRLEIIIGTAHGLAYLHEDSHIRIIHRDIKAPNILLDDKFCPKIADFGLARLFPDDQTHLTTRVGGTIGYTAPEYAVHGQLTEKADVYSYGVMVLEIVSGRKSINSTLPAHKQLLLGWAWSAYERNMALDIVDPNLEGLYEKEEALRVVHVALLCTQGTFNLRPSMSSVISMLTSDTEILVKPSQPAFINAGETHPSSSEPVSSGKSTSTSHGSVSFSLLPR